MTINTNVVLEVVGLHKSWGDRHVLRGIDLSVNAGEAIALLGPNGCGKSTLLRCINLLESYDNGHVMLHGQIASRGTDDALWQPDEAGAQQLRRRVGMVFQKFHLFPHWSVLQNVMAGPRHVLRMPSRQAEEVAARQLQRVGLAGFENRSPNTLSGGQQQRVAIARSLAMEPEVMLFDEATSALDPLMTRDVLATIRELAESGMTMLVVTHHLGFCRHVADRVAFLNHGKVEAIGTDAEVLDERPTDAIREFLEAAY